jgi:ribosomal protein S18 acetylase RimI-like enzyme
MDVVIERAGPGDWERYRGIRLRALAETPDAYASSLDLERRHTPQRWRELLAGAETYLAVAEGRVLGTATGWEREAGTVHLVAMYVAPQARGQRLAHRLIDAVRWSAEARDSRLLLEVAETNEAAIRCYLGYGFRPTGRRRAMERDARIVEIEFELPPVDEFARADPAQVGGRAADDHDR